VGVGESGQRQRPAPRRAPEEARVKRRLQGREAVAGAARWSLRRSRSSLKRSLVWVCGLGWDWETMVRLRRPLSLREHGARRCGSMATALTQETGSSR
jgi:hypothetical protein